MSDHLDFLRHLHALDVAIWTAPPGAAKEFDRPTGWSQLECAGNTARIKAHAMGQAFGGNMGGRVAVVDVDVRNGGDPDKVRELLNALNVTIYADILTPGGGRHFYIAGHPDLPTIHASEDRDGLTGYPGVEVISYGANAFLPGTLRPKYNGGGYVVLLDNLEALADGGDPLAGETFAGWVAEHRAHNAEPFAPSPPWDGAPPDKRQAAFLAKVLANQCAELAAMGPDSGRNHKLYTAGLKCGNLVAGAGMDEAQVIAQLTTAADACGLTRDDGPKSVQASICSGLRNGRARPRAVPPPKELHNLEQIPEGVDPATGEILDHEETPADRARRLFPRLDWHALWADDTEEEWVHYPLLPARRSVSIYSAPKVGKSLLMLEFAVAISRGETFLDYTPERRVRVLYVDFENDPRGDIRSRLQAMGYTPDDLDHVDYLSYPSMAGLDSERGALELLEAVKAYGSEIVVVDTVSRAVDGEENSNDTWLAMYRHTGLALKRAGIAIIRLDHTGKDEAKGTRGGSAKSGDVDAIWKLSRVTEDRFRLECTESRMALATKSLHLTRHTIPRLHHSVNTISAVTDFQAKVDALIGLLDSNGIDAHANRDAVRDFASSRGTKAAGRVIQEVVKRRKDAAPPELLPEFTPPEIEPGSAELDQEFTPFSDPLEAPDLSTKHLNSGARVQQSSPAHGTTELPGSSSNTARESSPVQAGRKCCYCHTEPEPPGGGICSTCTDLTSAAS